MFMPALVSSTPILSYDQIEKNSKNYGQTGAMAIMHSSLKRGECLCCLQGEGSDEGEIARQLPGVRRHKVLPSEGLHTVSSPG
jgi:hypothetical protein